MAEAYFNVFAPGGWRAVSAGAEPAGEATRTPFGSCGRKVDVSGKKLRILTNDVQRKAERFKDKFINGVEDV